jgi:predicted MFS family arabinose efflux permease
LWILAPSLPFLALLQIVAGVAWGAFELASFLLFFEALQDTERTSVLSAYNFAYAVSTVCGSLVGAALLSHYDHRIAYMVVFAASTLARLLALPLLPRRLPRPSMPETLVTRTLAVRPSAGAIERPILASMEAGPERER